jgi:hypothetical protein
MFINKKLKPLKAEQLSALPISIGEARKLLGADQDTMSDDEVARKILLMSELARTLRFAFDLHK